MNEKRLPCPFCGARAILAQAKQECGREAGAITCRQGEWAEFVEWKRNGKKALTQELPAPNPSPDTVLVDKPEPTGQEGVIVELEALRIDIAQHLEDWVCVEKEYVPDNLRQLRVVYERISDILFGRHPAAPVRDGLREELIAYLKDAEYLTTTEMKWAAGRIRQFYRELRI